MPSPPTHPVLIIGSGITGLALAQHLKRLGIPFRIYERDGRSDQRSQGYRIRINQTGLDSMKQCLPDAIYDNFVASTAENKPPSLQRRNPRNWAVVPGGFGPPPPPPSTGGGRTGPPPGLFSLPTDRRVLRSNLLVDIPVEYSKAFASYSISSSYEEGEPTVTAHFADGTSSPPGSLLVGADGVWSRVASQLSSSFSSDNNDGGKNLLKPKKTGSWMIYGKTPITDDLMRELKGEMGKGGMMLLVDDDDDDDQENGGGGKKKKITLFLEAMRFPRGGGGGGGIENGGLREEKEGDEKGEKSLFPADYIYWVLLASPATSLLPSPSPSPSPSPNPNPDDPEELSSSSPSSSSIERQIESLSPSDAADTTIRLTRGWLPQVRVLFERQDRGSTAVLRMTTSDPEKGVPEWDGDGTGDGDGEKKKKMVTLMGDAVHCMPPTGGSGANTGLRDAAVLGAKLEGVFLSTKRGEESQSLEEAVGEYEREMRGYASPMVGMSYRAALTSFGVEGIVEE